MMSEEEMSINSNVANGDAMDARLVALESAVSNIQQSFQLLLASKGPSAVNVSNQGNASPPGMSFLTTIISMSSSQSVCTQNSAPLFLPVASVGLNQPNMNTLPGPQTQRSTALAVAQASSVPSLAGWNIPK